MFGPGRPRQRPQVLGTAPLTKEELLTYTPRKNEGKVAKFRDSHHKVARLFATGMRPGEVATASGYSLCRISTLWADPAFQELIAVYRKEFNEHFAEVVAEDQYYTTINANRVIAARRLNDKLLDDEEEFTVSQLVAVHADAADRTGYPKRSVAVNVNVDFAAKLDQAIKRSSQVRTLEAKALPPPLPGSQPRDRGEGAGQAKAGSPLTTMTATSAPLRRRA